MSAPVIIVEGLIGAGKTTLLNTIEKYIKDVNKDIKKVCVVYEPVEDWKKTGILEQFYKGIESPDENVVSLTCYKFQTYAYVSRVDAINSAYKLMPDADIYIIERSIYSDRFFFAEMLKDSKMMTAAEHAAYLKIWRCWKNLIELPMEKIGFIYLKPSVNECMSRLKIRSRSEETGVSADYQIKLQDMHDKYLLNGTAEFLDTKYPCKVLQTDSNFMNDEVVIKKTMADINEFIAKLNAGDLTV